MKILAYSQSQYQHNPKHAQNFQVEEKNDNEIGN